MSLQSTLASQYTAVVAIDFGTTRSGYRFAYTATPDKIWPNKNWKRAPAEGKTLTEVLLKRSDFSFVAFGYEARDKFVASTNKDNYLYFSTFKMVLHNTEGAVRSLVKATNCDVTISTNVLISICLREIKDRAFQQLQTSRTVELEFDKIMWVITVPAIWDNAARQAMSNAAEKAGIHVNNIIIALEPEAAVLSCLENEAETSNLDVSGNDFMVVDAGGGTVDITVHRKYSAGGLVELHSPSGGTWGSSYINLQFEELLEMLFGKAHINQMKNTEDWYSIMDSFETVKINFSTEDPTANISVTAITPRDFPETNFATTIKNFNIKKGTSLEIERGMLRLATVIPVFFEPIISKIIKHIKKLLKKPSLQKVRYLFLVGGFAESTILQAKITNEFNNRMKVIIPPRPGTSVINGAVLYAFNPDAISFRIMTQTIGIGCVKLWNDKKHKGKLQIIGDNGLRYCNEEFSSFVKLGEKIAVNHVVKHEFLPFLQTQTVAKLNVYGSNVSENIEFISDKGVKLLGYLYLKLPDASSSSLDRTIDIEMKFGNTIFSVTATNCKSGNSANAKFSFILDEISTVMNFEF